jgi:glycosyltransferase involved in cell wall biosynthesis
VPVESSYHGSALLFRLLENYPAERLCILESDLACSAPERRIPLTTYSKLHVGSRRLLHTRFARYYSSWLTLRAASRATQIKKAIGPFRPEAVLTVAHGYSWVTAAAFAHRQNLPLHLICHDDWPRFANVFQRKRVDEEFSRIYRSSATRLCVSPYMRKNYSRRYGVDGTVLYPSRGISCPHHNEPPGRIAELTGLTVAFAGTVNSPGLVTLLNHLSAVLLELGGRLLIFGPISQADAENAGLKAKNITISGLLSSPDLIAKLRAEADVLFVPMSFLPYDRPNMEINFPSKLTDYTAVGLPILIYGPEYSSAVQWAQDNPGVAEVVTAQDTAHLSSSVRRVIHDKDYRLSLGAAALRVGLKYFDTDVALKTFYQALGQPTGENRIPDASH